MFPRRVALWGVLGAVLFSMAAIESAPAQGPLRRLLGRGRRSCCPTTSCCQPKPCCQPVCSPQPSCCGVQQCLQRCEAIYRCEACACRLKYPCDPGSQHNCKTIAQIGCLNCKLNCQEVPKRAADCNIEYQNALNECRNPDGTVSEACQLYANCRRAACEHRNICTNCTHLLECVAPGPGPGPGPDPGPTPPPSPIPPPPGADPPSNPPAGAAPAP